LPSPEYIFRKSIIPDRSGKHKLKGIGEKGGKVKRGIE
jgi:hypothetical protein